LWLIKIYQSRTNELAKENFNVDLAFFYFLGHEELETTQIYTEVNMKQLQEVHARTHPAKMKK
jgi:hypothetical protein